MMVGRSGNSARWMWNRIDAGTITPGPEMRCLRPPIRPSPPGMSSTPITESDASSVSAEKVLKRQRKQARREAKLMLEIEAAKKDLKKAQKKQSKAQVRLEERNTTLHTLEARLEELRIQNRQAATDETSQSTTDAEATFLAGEVSTMPEGSVVVTDATQVDTMQESEAAIVDAPAS